VKVAMKPVCNYWPIPSFTQTLYFSRWSNVHFTLWQLWICICWTNQTRP